MKRMFLGLAGLVLLSISTGCCCWYGSGYYGYPGACPGGGCSVPGAVPGAVPSTSYYPGSGSVHSVQMGVPETINGPVTYNPVMPAGAVTHTAAVPLQSLPTY